MHRSWMSIGLGLFLHVQISTTSEVTTQHQRGADSPQKTNVDLDNALVFTIGGQKDRARLDFSNSMGWIIIIAFIHTTHMKKLRWSY